MNKDAKRVALIFGTGIRASRLERNISLGKLSELSGVSKGELSKVERGLANVTLGTIKAICHAMDIRMKLTFDPKEAK